MTGVQPQPRRIVERVGLVSLVGEDQFYWSADRAIAAIARGRVQTRATVGDCETDDGLGESSVRGRADWLTDPHHEDDHLYMQSAEQVSRILRRKKSPNPFATKPILPEIDGKPRRTRTFWQEIWRWVVVLILFLALAVGVLTVSMFVAIYRDARLNQTQPVDAIVVLGAAQYNGTPSPVLMARLDSALTAYREGASRWIVVTGGKMSGDNFTEAQASKDYLVDQGIPGDHILMENSGRDSWESLQGAAVPLRSHGFKKVLLVSDGFHLFRVKLMMRDLGFTVYGRAASNSPIKPGSRTEISYMVRETGAVLYYLATKRGGSV